MPHSDMAFTLYYKPGPRCFPMDSLWTNRSTGLQLIHITRKREDLVQTLDQNHSQRMLWLRSISNSEKELEVGGKNSGP